MFLDSTLTEVSRFESLFSGGFQRLMMICTSFGSVWIQNVLRQSLQKSTNIRLFILRVNFFLTHIFGTGK